MGIEIQKSFHGAGRYSIQLHDGPRLLADYNVNRSQYDHSVDAEDFADGVVVHFTYSPVQILLVTKDGQPYDGVVRERLRTAHDFPWYLVHLTAALGDRYNPVPAVPVRN